MIKFTLKNWISEYSSRSLWICVLTEESQLHLHTTISILMNWGHKSKGLLNSCTVDLSNTETMVASMVTYLHYRAWIKLWKLERDRDGAYRGRWAQEIWQRVGQVLQVFRGASPNLRGWKLSLHEDQEKGPTWSPRKKAKISAQKGWE